MHWSTLNEYRHQLARALFGCGGITARKVVMTTISVAFLTWIGYAVFKEPWYGSLVLFGLFIHEHGHMWAARKLGFTADMSISPIGMAAHINHDFTRCCNHTTYIAIMGPFWGLIPTATYAILSTTTGLHLFSSALIGTIILNLFNLLPLGALDGGKIVRYFCYSRSQRAGDTACMLGIVTAIVATFWVTTPVLPIVAFISYSELRNERIRIKEKGAPRPIPPAALPVVAIFYGALLIIYTGALIATIHTFGLK